MRDRLASGGDTECITRVEEKNDDISLIERPANEFCKKHAVHAEKREMNGFLN